MGEPERLRPMAADRRTLDEPNGVGSRTSHGGGPDRMPGRGNPEQSVRAQEPPTGVGGTREPLPQSRPDPLELRGTSRDRDDRDPELPVERVQVDDVETSHDGPVEQDGAHAFEGPEASDERDHATRAVSAVDPDPADAYRLHALGQRQDHGGERGVAVRAVERAVVHPDHLRVRFPEGTPQR